MQKASQTSLEPSTAKSRSAIAALTRPPSIPVRRTRAEPVVAKRVAVVLRRGMRPLEFRRVEDAMEAHKLNCVPVVAGQRRAMLSDTPVCGLIVTGGDLEPSPVERELIEEAVRDLSARGAPILALTDAITIVSDALGVEEAPPKGAHAMLVNDRGVQFLDGAHQLAGVMKKLAAAPELAH